MSRMHIRGQSVFWLIFMFLCFAILPHSAFADDSGASEDEHVEAQAAPADIQKEVARVTMEIGSTRARWKAGVTSISLLPPGERRIRYGGGVNNKSTQGIAGAAPAQGYVDKTPGYVDKAYAAPMGATGGASALPSAFDWRNYNGHNYVTGVRHQGVCQSCWAFSVTAALESKILITRNTPDIDLNLSEEIVLACSDAGTCKEGKPGIASDFLQRTGTAGEAFGLYSATNGTMPRCVPAAGWRNASNNYRISAWRYVNLNTRPSVEALKNAVYDSGPVVTMMKIFDDFYHYESGVYSYTSGADNGLHAVVIVGWNDAQQAFIVKNSWGKAWGEKGYFRIAYSEIKGRSEFGNAQTLAFDKAITPKCIVAFPSTSETVPTAALADASVDVIASSPSCPWMATSDADWIKIISGSGSGNGRIAYTLDANTGRERTGTITVAGQAFAIRQAGTLNLPPGPQALPIVDSRPAQTPLCTLKASSRTILAGQSATLTASCLPAATAYQWTRSGTDMRDTDMPEFGKTTASGRVSPTETMTYSVIGSNAAGQGKAASITVTVRTPAPNAPTLLSAPKGQIQTLQPTYSWNVSAGATSYRLSIWQGSRILWDKTFPASSLGCQAGTDMCSIAPDLTLQNGARYGWWVKAINDSASPWSRPAYFEVVSSNLVTPPAPVTPTPVMPTPVMPTPVMPTPVMPTPVMPTPVPTPPVAPSPVTPAPVAPVPPGPSLPAPNLIGPDGINFSGAPTFSWHASAGATSYKLSIDGSRDTVVSLTFSAAEAGCASGTGKCSVSPGIALKEFVYKWSVTALNGQQSSQPSRTKTLWLPFSAAQ